MIFTYPVFLWGLFALIIPIAIHLFNFRRYKKVYFSNVERLEELHSETHRQSVLREWLVLAARLLVITFVVLAFAHPVIPHNGQALHSGSTVVSIYVDNSFSMENAATEGSLIDIAKQKAREIAEVYDADGQFQLLTSDMTGDEFRWLNRDEFLDALDGIEISSASRRLSEVATRQCDFMARSGAANRFAYVISDFQASLCDFDALPTDSSVLFTLVPLDGMGVDNLFIDTVRLDAPAYFVGGRVEAEVQVRNCGHRAVDKVPVKLYTAGRERAMATLDVPAEGTAKAHLSYTLDESGWVDSWVEISDYPVVFDDKYYFTLLADQRVHMMEFDNGNPNEALGKLFGADSVVEFKHRAATAFDVSLTDYNFIVLNEIERLPSGVAQSLASWVLDGGSLLVIPPADGNMADLNVLMALLQAPHLDRWIPQQMTASSIEYQSSLYRNVFSGKNEEMELPVVQGRYRLDNTGAVKQTIIALADGGEMLTYTPAGEGHLYLFTQPLREEWSNLTSQALFVPTIYNMALYSHHQPVTCHTLGTADAIVLQGNYDVTARPPELAGEGVSLLPDIRKNGNRRLLMLHGELSSAGFYRLADEHLAFNYDRRESMLTFISHDDVEMAVAKRSGYTTVRNAERPLTEELRERNDGHRLWRTCLWLALLAWAIEIVLLKWPTMASRKNQKPDHATGN